MDRNRARHAVRPGDGLRGVLDALPDAVWMLDAVRDDVVGRVGGEELAWLMPETDADGASEAADRLRRAIAASAIGGAAARPPRSGSCTAPHTTPTPRSSTDAADAALFGATRQGRDRVVVA